MGLPLRDTPVRADPGHTGAMDMTVTRTGPARPADVWQHYERLDLWTVWAPHLTNVRADSTTLAPGTSGVVTALGVVPAAFRVMSVRANLHSWSWRVRVGPVTLELTHDVAPTPRGGSRADVRIQGPAPVLLAYRPLMGWALARLVRVGPAH